METKQCTKCKEILPKEKFYWDKKNNWYSSGACKQCTSNQTRQKHKNHRDLGILPTNAKLVPSYKNTWATTNGEIWGYHSINGYYKRRTHLNKDGYERVTTRRNNNTSTCASVHRLVAEAHLSTWDINLHVNHIDGIKTNNNTYNLEMVTPQENMLHSSRILGNKLGYATFNQWTSGKRQINIKQQ